jgi:putative ABC transport system ATP-binding protein
MSVATEFPKSPRRAQTVRTLLDFLLDLFELGTEPTKALTRLKRVDAVDSLDGLAAIGDAFGLRMERVRLSPNCAAEASGPQTPLVARLSDDHGWLVLHGFSGGRVRAALTRGELIEQRLLKPKALAELLQLPEGEAGDFLLVQAKAPLAGAVSHDHHAHLPPFRRLVELMRAEHRDLWLILGLAIGAGLLALAPPVAVQALVNTVAMGGMGQPLVVLATILFIFLAFSGAVHVLESYLVELVQRRIFVRLAADLAHRLPKVSREVYERHHGAELVNRFFDVLTIQKAGSSLLLDGLTTVIQAVIGLVLLAFYHPFLLAFDIVLLLAIGFIMFVLARGAVATAIGESIAKYALVAWLEDIARNPWTFKSDGGPDLAAERTDALAHTYLSAKCGHYRVLLRQVVGSVALYAVASTALLAIGGYLVIEGQLTLGQLVAAELIVSTVLASLIKFGKQLEGFYDLMAGVDKIGHLLDLPLERERGAVPDFAGPVALAVHGLSYGHGARRPVLHKLDFAVRAGGRVAVFGGFGSGKSTLADLLYGLRKPDAGHIEIDGVDLAVLRLDALRARVAVAGPVEIIEDSLFENVRLGRARIGPDEVERALDAVGLLAEVMALPEAGLDTELGPNGAPLSAAQTRLLLLARAIAGRPALLIVDGLLDGMDEAGRSHAAAVLFAADAPWTLLVLTSDASVAALCERRVDLPGGETRV